MFKKGASGNPGGRPKSVTANTTAQGPVHKAWLDLVKKKPWLLKEALERGLEGKKASVYLELGAKLGREIGGDEENKNQVVIIMNSPLDAGSLRQGAKQITVLETQPLSAEIMAMNEPLTALEAETLEAEVEDDED